MWFGVVSKTEVELNGTPLGRGGPGALIGRAQGTMVITLWGRPTCLSLYSPGTRRLLCQAASTVKIGCGRSFIASVACGASLQARPLPGPVCRRVDLVWNQQAVPLTVDLTCPPDSTDTSGYLVLTWGRVAHPARSQLSRGGARLGPQRPRPATQ